MRGSLDRSPRTRQACRNQEHKGIPEGKDQIRLESVPFLTESSQTTGTHTQVRNNNACPQKARVRGNRLRGHHEICKHIFNRWIPKAKSLITSLARKLCALMQGQGLTPLRLEPLKSAVRVMSPFVSLTPGSKDDIKKITAS